MENKNDKENDTNVIGSSIEGLAIVVGALIGVCGKSFASFIFGGGFIFVICIISKKRILCTVGIATLFIMALIMIVKPEVGKLWGDERPISTFGENNTSQVETHDPLEYTMVVYVTQENVAPDYFRNFRDFSISGNLESYGARTSYGEKHFEIQVTSEQLDSATKYGPGELIPNINELYVGGYNRSSEIAYVMPIAIDDQGRYYPLFIKGEIK